jgi:hypothetical protein
MNQTQVTKEEVLVHVSGIIHVKPPSRIYVTKLVVFNSRQYSLIITGCYMTCVADSVWITQQQTNYSSPHIGKTHVLCRNERSATRIARYIQPVYNALL